MIGGSVIVERALRRDRVLVVSCLLFVVALSWAYLLSGAGMMQGMGDMLMPMSTGPWTLERAVLVLVMWAVMMAAMMLPSAAPIILLYATISRRRSERGEPASASGVFAFGYIAVWATFSLAATALQYGLEKAALMSPMMQTTSIALASGSGEGRPASAASTGTGRRRSAPFPPVQYSWSASSATSARPSPDHTEALSLPG